ncbi:MBL fold metallo-hydrolase [Pandoraea capi]|uniref:MBL fold metallo-hydrolase n=1 Tax=Pandoraea TaxID=93217 RepID=UPI001F5D1AB5|nr:MBL fold metallo-hydrolase [Pandoraea capi]
MIDPLTSVETAKASLDLVNSKVEKLPVTGVIFTHSHVDHFAGVRGVVDEKDVRSGKVPLVGSRDDHIVRVEQAHQEDGRDAQHRRCGHRLPDGAGHRSAGGNAVLLPAVQGDRSGRGCHAHVA